MILRCGGRPWYGVILRCGGRPWCDVILRCSGRLWCDVILRCGGRPWYGVILRCGGRPWYGVRPLCCGRPQVYVVTTLRCEGGGVEPWWGGEPVPARKARGCLQQQQQVATATGSVWTGRFVGESTSLLTPRLSKLQAPAHHRCPSLTPPSSLTIHRSLLATPLSLSLPPPPLLLSVRATVSVYTCKLVTDVNLMVCSCFVCVVLCVCVSVCVLSVIGF